MAAKTHRDHTAKRERDRSRIYTARRAVHDQRRRRRVRDNVVGSVGVVIVVAVAATLQVVYFGLGPGKPEPAPQHSTAAPSPSVSPSPEADGVPPKTLAEGRDWSGTMTIAGVPLGFTLDGAAAPQAVSSEISLIREGFYEGTVCHRLTTAPHFKVLQCGDPNGDDPDKAGTGGPGYHYGPIENAPADGEYPKGTIAMARSAGDAESMGSQFFIVYGDTEIQADSAGGYSVIGTVTSGLDTLISTVADKGAVGGGQDGRPAVTTTIDSITID